MDHDLNTHIVEALANLVSLVEQMQKQQESQGQILATLVKDYLMRSGNYKAVREIERLQ